MLDLDWTGWTTWVTAHRVDFSTVPWSPGAYIIATSSPVNRVIDTEEERFLGRRIGLFGSTFPNTLRANPGFRSLLEVSFELISNRCTAAIASLTGSFNHCLVSSESISNCSTSPAEPRQPTCVPGRALRPDTVAC